MNRKDYMNKAVTHHQYYSSVADGARIDLSKHKDLTKWRDMLASGDEHLNKLGLTYWDQLAANNRLSIAISLKTHGDFWSLAGGVCTIKAAVQRAVEKNTETA